MVGQLIGFGDDALSKQNSTDYTPRSIDIEGSLSVLALPFYMINYLVLSTLVK